MKKTRKWFRSLFRRRVYVSFLLLLQIVLIAYLVISGSNYGIVNIILTIISLLVALHVISKDENSAYKLLWVFLILLFPVLGGVLYLLFKFQSSTKKFAKQLSEVDERSKEWNLPSSMKQLGLKEDLNEYLPLMNYLQDFSNFPVYSNSETFFLPSGEEMLKHLLMEIKKAEKYIFLEYFIIQEGLMWNSILEILQDKVQQGVEVRVIYDDIGCFLLLPDNYHYQLQEKGIKCAVFNKFRPFLTNVQNNRDHRKLAIIDGKVAFTGGINLSDEYINAYERCGHWKDSCIMIKGKAVWSFTLMFLQMWSICKNDNDCYLDYYPWKHHKCNNQSDGLIQPYADSPMDKENIGEHVYLQIINRAKEYVYISTPYLIIDDNVLLSLKLAAKSGIDVKIMLPYKWDKKLVHFTTRSYYRDLIKEGVRIYEYSEGFVHSKFFISDDKIAAIGTTNLDFRSLYLNFECGSCIYDATCIKDMKRDFVKTLATCKEITSEDCKVNFFTKVLQDICRLFAPLM